MEWLGQHWTMYGGGAFGVPHTCSTLDFGSQADSPLKALYCRLSLHPQGWPLQGEVVPARGG